MFKKPVILTRPPRRAKTRLSTVTAAALYVVPSRHASRITTSSLSVARTPLAGFFNILLGRDALISTDRLLGILAEIRKDLLRFPLLRPLPHHDEAYPWKKHHGPS
jgi:hypothetical protein